MGHYIGLDLGGTNIKAGVVNDQGQIVAKESRPTKSDQPAEAIVGQMIESAESVVQQAGLPMQQIAAVGIGSPGPIDFEHGSVEAAPNLPQLKGVALQDLIAQATGRPAILENDANAAAFGEYWVGAGQDPSIRHLVMLTLGTGIGSGVVIDGRILHGGFGLAGEGGHMIVMPNGRLCSCGQLGCLESYASASNTARRAAELIQSGVLSGGQSGGEAGGKSSLAALIEPGGSGITAKDVFDAAKTGDELANQIVDQTALYLGVACVSLCRLFDPQMIVFAGGMILAGDFLFDRVRAVYTRHNWRMTPSRVQIVPARLGNDAGLIGAAAVAREATQPGDLV